MASAIRASGERRPNAILVSNRILVLTDSISALDRPWSSVAWILPRIAVISAGRNNDYGHPRPETLAALSSVTGLAVYRTDTDGRVVVESDGRRLRVRTEG